MPENSSMEGFVDAAADAFADVLSIKEMGGQSASAEVCSVQAEKLVAAVAFHSPTAASPRINRKPVS